MIPIVKHQTQPCMTSCATTCMAMIAGKPVAELIPKIHQPYRDGSLTLRDMLHFVGASYEAFESIDETALDREGVYLCTAPSLNIVAGLHQILVEVTLSDYFVLDPVLGRDGKKFYVKRGHGESSPLAVELGGFVVDAFVSRDSLLRFAP